METTKTIATDYTVPFRTREHQSALPTLAAVGSAVQGTGVPASGMGAPFGAGVRPDATFVLTTGVLSASCQASPL
jgi:hypothetical protein